MLGRKHLPSTPLPVSVGNANCSRLPLFQEKVKGDLRKRGPRRLRPPPLCAQVCCAQRHRQSLPAAPARFPVVRTRVGDRTRAPPPPGFRTGQRPPPPPRRRLTWEPTNQGAGRPAAAPPRCGCGCAGSLPGAPPASSQLRRGSGLRSTRRPALRAARARASAPSLAPGGSCAGRLARRRGGASGRAWSGGRAGSSGGGGGSRTHLNERGGGGGRRPSALPGLRARGCDPWARGCAPALPQVIRTPCGGVALCIRRETVSPESFGTRSCLDERQDAAPRPEKSRCWRTDHRDLKSDCAGATSPSASPGRHGSPFPALPPARSAGNGGGRRRPRPPGTAGCPAGEDPADQAARFLGCLEPLRRRHRLGAEARRGGAHGRGLLPLHRGLPPAEAG